MTQLTPTVFVVDDDKAVRDSLCWLVSSVDLPVLAFSTAQDFLNAVEPWQRGCVIVDIRMPGINGLQLQQEIKERYENLSVIIITAHGTQQVADTAMAQGAIGYLEKPLDDEVLFELLQKSIEDQSEDLTAKNP